MCEFLLTQVLGLLENEATETDLLAQAHQVFAFPQYCIARYMDHGVTSNEAIEIDLLAQAHQVFVFPQLRISN